MKTNVDAVDVASYFVEHSGYTKTHLQIQKKLTYISLGYMLSIYDEKLFKNKVEACERGPVIPDIWRAFKLGICSNRKNTTKKSKFH